MPRTWNATQVTTLASRHPDWFGLPRHHGPLPPVVAHLADGESYAAWTARVAGAPRPVVVIRAARRARGELPADPEEEFTGLSLAPTGLAPEPIALIQHPEGGEQREAGGAAYPIIVEALAPGRVLPAAQWTPRHREWLAQVLARLHEPTWPGPGAVTTRADNPPRPIRFDEHIAGVTAHWGRLLPHGETGFGALANAMAAYAAQVTPQIAAVSRFALLHGDPVLTNILVAAERVTLVDWEWTQVGDPARDLGFLGGAIHADPWYAPLADTDIDGFLGAYLDAGGRGDVDGLRRRRDAWLAAEAFGVLGYLLWLAADPEQSALPRHRRGAVELARTLTAFLQPWA
ncbi:MAG: hypothetical protein V9G19_01880 [Tetrasphaera sp.]